MKTPHEDDPRCALDGCARLAKSKGYCKTHYMRLWKYGDATVNAAAKNLPCTTDGCDGLISRQSKLGLCAVCFKRYDNEHGSRHSRLKANYGITLAEYEAMLAAQGGCCAICGGVNANGRRLAVDHDHGTGAVRALLCHGCNVGIGYLGDDPDRLMAAAAYLLTHSSVDA